MPRYEVTVIVRIDAENRTEAENIVENAVQALPQCYELVNSDAIPEDDEDEAVNA